MVACGLAKIGANLQIIFHAKISSIMPHICILCLCMYVQAEQISFPISEEVDTNEAMYAR